MKTKILILLLMMAFCVNEASFMPAKAASTTKTVSVPPNGGWVVHGIYARSESSSSVYATNCCNLQIIQGQRKKNNKFEEYIR